MQEISAFVDETETKLHDVHYSDEAAFGMSSWGLLEQNPSPCSTHRNPPATIQYRFPQLDHTTEYEAQHLVHDKADAQIDH
jgi:hypothetical protein